MDIGDDVQVGLKVFCLVNKARKTIGKPVERKTNSILKKKTQFYFILVILNVMSLILTMRLLNLLPLSQLDTQDTN